MNLKAIREQFIQASGRRDLVHTDGSDDGANWFINQGQRMLDLSVNLPQAVRHYNATLAPGEYSIAVADLRSVDEVWVSTASTPRVQLERMDLSEVRARLTIIQSESGNTLTPQIQHNAGLTYAGAARGFAVGIGVASSQNKLSSLRSIGDNDGLRLGHIDRQIDVVITPPALEASTVWIKGLFWSPALRLDGDASAWTLLYESTLLHASLYQLEVFYRNTEGANDWLRAVQMSLSNIEADSAMKDQGWINQMEG